MRRTAAALILLAAGEAEPPPPAARLCADVAVDHLRYRGEAEVRDVTRVDDRCVAVTFAAMTRFNAPGEARAVCCFADAAGDAPLTSLEVDGRRITGAELEALLAPRD